jgi:hypothetical protein
MPRPPDDPDEGRPSPDLRAPVLALSAWAGGLAIFRLPGWTCLVLLAVVALWVVARAWHGQTMVTVAACLAAAAAVGVVLSRRWSIVLCVALVVAMLRPLPTPGWPPRPGLRRLRRGSS